MRFFFKSALTGRAYDAVGRPIPAERLNQDLEVIATDDPEVLKTLDGFLKQGIGGVSETTEAAILDLKKKAASLPKRSDDFYGGPRAAMDTTTQSLPSEDRVAAAVGSSMLPLKDEIAKLKEEMAAIKEKAPDPKKDVPPPTPPAVGKRSHHKH